MEIDTPGGVIRGYWATGRYFSAMPPINVMTTDRTVAKIGRSMKKRANMPGASLVGSARTFRVGLRLGAGRSGWGFGRLAVEDGGTAERWHVDQLRPDFHPRADLLQPADNYPFARLQPVRD